jgi:23S rRNA pseudouridine1911/1915/1917 synthase
MPKELGVTIKSRLDVLFEDNHLLVINKPAGLATMGVMEGTASAVTEARRYLKAAYNKPGNVYIGVVSRLDALVSGVLVLARTSKAAARLTEQFRESAPEKIYWAVVDAAPHPAAENLEHWVLKDEQHHRMTVVRSHTAGAQRAKMSYRTLETLPAGALLEVQLQTGRKHQIRLQLAEIGCPVRGDRKYGNRQAFPAGIALHARRLAIDHPTKKTRLEFAAPLPAAWRKLGIKGK